MTPGGLPFPVRMRQESPEATDGQEEGNPAPADPSTPHVGDGEVQYVLTAN